MICGVTFSAMQKVWARCCAAPQECDEYEMKVVLINA
jgi:hypothetical protein